MSFYRKLEEDPSVRSIKSGTDTHVHNFLAR